MDVKTEKSAVWTCCADVFGLDFLPLGAGRFIPFMMTTTMSVLLSSGKILTGSDSRNRKERRRGRKKVEEKKKKKESLISDEEQTATKLHQQRENEAEIICQSALETKTALYCLLRITG